MRKKKRKGRENEWKKKRRNDFFHKIEREWKNVKQNKVHETHLRKNDLPSLFTRKNERKKERKKWRKEGRKEGRGETFKN